MHLVEWRGLLGRWCLVCKLRQVRRVGCDRVSMCKGAKSEIELTLNLSRLLAMAKVAIRLQSGVARPMLKTGEGGWCAWSCFDLRCFGGEVSRRRRGGFSICTRSVGSCSKNTRGYSGDLRGCLLHREEWLQCSVCVIAFEALACQCCGALSVARSTPWRF